MPRPVHQSRQRLKGLIDAVCRVAVAPCVWMCAPGDQGARRQAAFDFWAQALALVPGLPGVFLRRAFYRGALRSAASSFFVGFGAVFSRARADVEDDVYVGPYAIVGACRLRRGCLVGTRASIVSGTRLHDLDASGRWMPSDESRLVEVELGEHAWVGEGAIVLADVGPGAMVAAGAVVAHRVPPRVMVGGNPARFVRHITAQKDGAEVAGAM